MEEGERRGKYNEKQDPEEDCLSRLPPKGFVLIEKEEKTRDRNWFGMALSKLLKVCLGKEKQSNIY